MLTKVHQGVELFACRAEAVVIAVHSERLSSAMDLADPRPARSWAGSAREAEALRELHTPCAGYKQHILRQTDQSSEPGHCQAGVAAVHDRRGFF